MKPFPLYTQLDAMDCGPTCLRMVAKFYGRNYTLQTLREKSFITRQGVSLLGISDAAESIGFHTMGVRINFEQLIEGMSFPCILHWNQNHFVVCYEAKKQSSFFSKGKKEDYIIKIADPVGEKYAMTKEEFLKCWISSRSEKRDTGIALVLEPTPDFYEHEDDQKIQ